jgi:hypothetical protein
MLTNWMEASCSSVSSSKNSLRVSADLPSPADDVFEGAGEGGTVPRPGHRLGPDPAAPRAAQPADRRLDEGAFPPDRQVAPAAGVLLEPAAHLGATVRAAQQAEAGTGHDDQSVVFEPNASYPEAWKVEQVIQ